MRQAKLPARSRVSIRRPWRGPRRPKSCHDPAASAPSGAGGTFDSTENLDADDLGCRPRSSRLFSGQGVLPNAVGIALVALGAGMQVYDAWSRLPTHCQSVLSIHCPAQAPTAAKSKRR
jgi:hypothetical protein